MGKTRLEFYALPEEQKAWLQALLKQQPVWCICERSCLREPVRVEPQDVVNLNFETKTEFEWALFLGLKTLTKAPVFRPTPQGSTLDFVKSLAIQYVPSLVCAPDILIEGQLAVMRKFEYELAKLPWQHLFQWFRELTRSFRRTLGFKGAVLVQHTTLGTVKEWRGVLLSKGAVEWRLNGRRLKQFPRGEVEFDLRLMNAGRGKST